MNWNKILATLALVPALVGAGTVSAEAATPPATVLFNAASGNQQGLATDGHYTWVSYDVGGGLAKIKTYTWNGTYIGTSPSLALGHAAELDYRVRDGNLYVANGGLETSGTSADTKVYRVSLYGHVARAVTKVYDFGWLGRNGMVGVDNVADRMVVIGGPDAGPWNMVTRAFDSTTKTVRTLRTNYEPTVVADDGVLLQGIAQVKGQTWLYISEDGVNRIDKFTAGVKTDSVTLPYTGEAEGITVNPITGSIYAGAHSVNRVLRVTGV